MKTVGIITYHNSYNYGAILQAYALQKVVIGLGYAPEFIDYCNPQRGLSELSFLRRLVFFSYHGMVKKILVGSARQNKTEAFRQNHLRISGKKYVDAQSLHASPPVYDAYITGSDQVWNPKIQGNDPSYFLTFAQSGKRRISYAASFGVAKINERFNDDYKQWLGQIHDLSIRENEGKNIIDQLTGRKAEVVLDPTLLLDREQWRNIAVPHVSSEPYILCYYMPGDELVNKGITSFARRVRALTGWKIICIGQKEYMRLNFFKCSIFDAGPAEYLGLFQNASFIITNSFHGAAFSINYRKPFLVPINDVIPPEKSLSSRITTLMKTFNLESRLIPAGCNHLSEDALKLEFSDVEPILEKERNRSISFLKDALEDK